jgi:hypothetical protein
MESRVIREIYTPHWTTFAFQPESIPLNRIQRINKIFPAIASLLKIRRILKLFILELYKKYVDSFTKRFE